MCYLTRVKLSHQAPVHMGVSWKSLCLLLVAALCHPSPAQDYGTVPNWTLRASSGETVSCAGLRGKIVVIDFWASWSPPCRREVLSLVELQRTYRSQGVLVVGFSFDHDEQVHAEWVRSHGLNYPSIFARSAPALEAVRALVERVGPIDSVPTTLIVDRSGTIRWRYDGFAPKAEFDRRIKELLGSP